MSDDRQLTRRKFVTTTAWAAGLAAYQAATGRADHGLDSPLVQRSLTSDPGASLDLQAHAHIWDIREKFGGTEDDLSPAIAKALVAAKQQLAASPKAIVRIQIPAGTWHISDTICLDQFTPEEGGQLVLEGAGLTRTTVILKSSGDSRFKHVISMMGSERITIQNVYFRREKLHTTQGFVEDVKGNTLLLRTLQGFPNPADFLLKREGRAGKYLRRYCYDDKAAPYPDPTHKNQVPWRDLKKIDDDRVAFGIPRNSGFKKGDLLGVKFKLRGYLIFGNVSYCTVRNIRYTHGSLGGIILWWLQRPTRGKEMGNNVFENIIINRPDELIDGWAPCLSQPGDGFRIYGNDLQVKNCTVIATGDDGIALDGGTRQKVIGCTVDDCFARGIIAHGSHGRVGDVLVEGCTVRRSALSSIVFMQLGGRSTSDPDHSTTSTSIVKNSIVVMPASHPAIAAAIGSGPSHVIIEGNRIVKARSDAPSFHIGRSAISVTFSNNVIESWSDSTDGNTTTLMEFQDPAYLSGDLLHATGAGNVMRSPSPATVEKTESYDRAKVKVEIQWERN